MALVESWVLLRNALAKVIAANRVPQQEDFEFLLFEDLSIAEADSLSWSGKPEMKREA